MSFAKAFCRNYFQDIYINFKYFAPDFRPPYLFALFKFPFQIIFWILATVSSIIAGIPLNILATIFN